MKNDQYFKLSACILANDQVIGLTEELGIEGFGAFVSLLLELRQRDDYRCAIHSLAAIARRLNTTKELLLRVVYRFGLFRVDEDEQLFSSPYLDEVMGSLEARRKKYAINRENGLKGGRPPKCPKGAEELTENPAEISTGTPAEKPNSEPIEKPNRKPNSKPTEKPNLSETPMDTGRKPNQNPVEKSIEEKSKVEKRTSSTSVLEAAAGVESKTELEVELELKSEVKASAKTSIEAEADIESGVRANTKASVEPPANVATKIVLEAKTISPISETVVNVTHDCSKSWNALLDEAFRDSSWVEIQAMQSGCGMPFVEHKEAVKALFHTHVLAQGTAEKLFSSADVRSYFSNFNRPGTPTHLRIVDLLKRACAPRSREDPYRYEQRNPHNGQRSYCGCLIPPDAPPRPTENSVWSDELRQWG